LRQKEPVRAPGAWAVSQVQLVNADTSAQSAGLLLRVAQA
jgi:hypothetical protein